MLSEDNIAAATIAKIFGSELLHAQQNSRTDGGAVPNFVTIHPRDILNKSVSQNPQQQLYSNNQQKQMLEFLQREAESAYPLAEAPRQSTTAPVQQLPTITQNHQEHVAQNIETTPATPNLESSNVWERINTNLERIANRLEAIELTAKKAKVKRKTIHENRS
jgi:hypothetical protein